MEIFHPKKKMIEVCSIKNVIYIKDIQQTNSNLHAISEEIQCVKVKVIKLGVVLIV